MGLTSIESGDAPKWLADWETVFIPNLASGSTLQLG